MTQVRTQSKVLALVLAMAMAVALSLALAPSAFAVDWNDNVVVTAKGGNSGYDAGGAKTDPGQYITVTMQFGDSTDLSGLDADALEEYLQANVKIADRWLDGRTAGYQRDVTVAADAIDDVNKTVTFTIGANVAGMTANYNGCLLILASDDYAQLNALMGGKDVETLIGTGVAIQDCDGELNADGSKTFTIDSGAFNRGMVHVLILDENGALFTNTGTFSNGGLTIHAHSFITQTPADFANLICSTANSLVDAENADELVLGYEFEALGGGSFTVTDADGDCGDVQVFIYDCDYLNAISGAVGDITEPEMQNN